MTKRLLTETMVVHGQGNLNESVVGPRYLVESSGKTLRVKLPVTTLGVQNENGRTYSQAIMEGAIRNAKSAFENRELLSTVDGHPNEAYCEPGNASHIVVEAWCQDGYMWNTWEVIETSRGRDLRALIEAGASFGVSIRGLGSQDRMGNILEDYEYLGTDGVGNPSARIRTRAEVVNRPEASVAESVNRTSTHHPESSMNKQGFVRDFKAKLTSVRENVNKRDAVSLIQDVMHLEESLNSQKLLTITESHTLAGELAGVKTQINQKLNGSDARRAVEESQRDVVKSQKRINELTEGLTTAIDRLRSSGEKTRRMEASASYQRRAHRRQLEQKDAQIKALEERLAKAQAMVSVAVSEAANITARNRVLVRRVAESELALSVAIKESGKMVAEARTSNKSQVKESVDQKTGRVIPVAEAKKTEAVAPRNVLDLKLTESNKSGEVRVPGFI